MARIREQPTRRSARIASREGSAAPSLASEEGQREHEEEKEHPATATDYTALRQHMTLSRIASPPAPSSPPETSVSTSASPTPAERTSPVAVAIAAQTTTPARPNLLRRAFGFLSSPFGASLGLDRSQVQHSAARSSSLQLQYNASQPSTPTMTPQQPLGELPASRKRTAREIEPEHESQPREPGRMPDRASARKPAIAVVSATPTRLKTPRGPSTLNRNHRSSLTAISERSTENSTATATARAPEPTPSRHRTISSVRSKREQALSTTPGRPRAWIRPPIPREPNADNRLAKLNHYNEMKQHVQSLEKDEELREMVAHRTKRVKIDDLLYIPHNRPGDPSGTFRVYDDDSDDEMEVDEDVELRKNVFEEVTMDEPSPSKPQGLSQSKRQDSSPSKKKELQAAVQKKVQSQVQRVAPSPGELLHAQMVAGTPLEPHQLQVPLEGNAWVFPSVSKRQDVYQEGTAQEARLGAIFKVALDHWTRSGEILPVF